MGDPSADSSPRSFQLAGTSKLSSIISLRNRSGQAVNWEGSTPIYDSNALSVLGDPSADSSPRSFQSSGTSKLSFLIQFRNRSGQAVNWEGSTPIYDSDFNTSTLEFSINSATARDWLINELLLLPIFEVTAHKARDQGARIFLLRSFSYVRVCPLSSDSVQRNQMVLK